MPAGLGVAVPVAAPMPAVDNIRWKLVMLTPQTLPSQVAVPFVGTGQAAQELPQVSTLLLDTHEPPQLWKPVGHWNPHCSPSQVAVALAGAVQVSHDVVPQLATPELATQAPPHR